MMDPVGLHPLPSDMIVILKHLLRRDDPVHAVLRASPAHPGPVPLYVWVRDRVLRVGHCCRHLQHDRPDTASDRDGSKYRHARRPKPRQPTLVGYADSPVGAIVQRNNYFTAPRPQSGGSTVNAIHTRTRWMLSASMKSIVTAGTGRI